MTFTINTKTLAAGLKPMAKLVKGKITIPVLAGIHVRAAEGIAEFTATDLETAVRFKLEHTTDGLKAETVIADGKGFIKAISGKGQTTIAIEETRVLVSCNGAQLAFPVLSAESYPTLPVLTPDTLLVGVTADNLTSMINRTSYAISKEESRFALNGALLEVDLPRLRMVATDGHRLAMADSICDPISSAMFPHKRILINRFALSLIGAWSGNSTVHIGRQLVEWKDSDGKVAGSHEHVFAIHGNTTVITRHLSGQFPDYERVLPRPEPNRYTLMVDRLPLLATLQTAVKYADERSKAVRLVLNGCCKVVVKKSDSPSFVAEVPATWNGPEDGETSYNAEYLIDWLKAQSIDTVLMAFSPDVPSVDKDGNPTTKEVWNISPMDCYGDHAARTVIMPMRM